MSYSRQHLMRSYLLMTLFHSLQWFYCLLYSGDPNTQHLNTANILIPNIMKVRCQILTIQKPDVFAQISNGQPFQNRTFLSGFGMVPLAWLFYVFFSLYIKQSRLIFHSKSKHHSKAGHFCKILRAVYE